MVRADYRCDRCGWIVERDASTSPDAIRCDMPTGTADDDPYCDGTMRRVWSAPHMGAMSSGEPPR